MAALKERRRQPRADGVIRKTGLVGLVAPVRTPMAVPAPPPVVVRVIALPAKAVPEAAGFGGLRRRNPDQQGDRRQRAQDELHLAPRDLSRPLHKTTSANEKFRSSPPGLIQIFDVDLG